MRKLTVSLMAALSLCAGAGFAQSTTNALPVNTGSFFQDALSYFSSFNTNLDTTFQTKGSLWTGVDSIQGAPVALANSLGVSYKVYKALSLESVTRNSGVAGTLVSEQAGLGFSWEIHDTRITVYGDGGYWLYNAEGSPWFGEVGVRLQKALSAHTYAWVGAGAQLPANRQVFSAGVGITF